MKSRKWAPVDWKPRWRRIACQMELMEVELTTWRWCYDKLRDNSSQFVQALIQDENTFVVLFYGKLEGRIRGHPGVRDEGCQGISSTMSHHQRESPRNCGRGKECTEDFVSRLQTTLSVSVSLGTIAFVLLGSFCALKWVEERQNVYLAVSPRVLLTQLSVSLAVLLVPHLKIGWQSVMGWLSLSTRRG